MRKAFSFTFSTLAHTCPHGSIQPLFQLSYCGSIPTDVERSGQLLAEPAFKQSHATHRMQLIAADCLLPIDGTTVPTVGTLPT